MSSTATKTARFKDTMISATDSDAMVRFYTEFAGLEITQETDDFTMLTDPETGQSLCITKGSAVSATSPGIEVDNLDNAITQLTSLGGSVLNQWDFAPMSGANCADPEGNEVMIWCIKK